MAWILKEGQDIRPAMTEEQIMIFKQQYPEEFYKIFKEVWFN